MKSAALAKLRLVDMEENIEEEHFEPIDPLPQGLERLFFWMLITFSFACLYGIIKLIGFVYRNYF